MKLGLQCLVEHKKSLVALEIENELKLTPLLVAAKSGQTEAVQFLISAGAKVCESPSNTHVFQFRLIVVSILFQVNPPLIKSNFYSSVFTMNSYYMQSLFRRKNAD